MKEGYIEIKVELEIMKEELETRLKKERMHQYHSELGEELIGEIGSQYDDAMKKKLVIHHIREDLKDVNRALLKMDMGIYGICEETGQPLSIKQLKIIPTTRTVHELGYQRLKLL